jgi:6-phosphogluconolactonase
MAQRRLFIGTHTHNTQAQGIYRCDWDSDTGKFAAPVLAARADNPSFIVAHGHAMGDPALLVVNELSDYAGEPQGAVSDYRITADGLELRAMRPSHGADPCHVAVHGNEAAVANYTGGTIARFRVDGSALGGVESVVRFAVSGPHRRQKSSHPHGVYYHGDELWVVDLGGDCVHRFRHASGHALAPLAFPAGSGTRHLARSSSGRIYVVNELTNTVHVYDQGAVVQTVATLPEDATARSSTAEILLTAAEDRLVVSNRGHDSLVSWPVDPADGRLGTASFCPSGGGHPRHFLIIDDRWILVANRDSNNLTARRLEADGSFGAEVDRVEVPAPVCITPV